MKSYLELIPISSKIHKKQNRMTLLCIILAVFLVSVIFGMADMELQSQKIRAIIDYGNWHIMLKNISEKDAQLIAARPDVKAASWYNTLNYRLADKYYINKKKTVICGFDETLIKDIVFGGKIVEGEYPKNNKQVILTENAKSLFHLNIGDTVSLTIPSGKLLYFTISGFAENTAKIMNADAIGTFVTIETFKDLYQSETNKKLLDSDMVYYVQFSESCNIREAIKDIKIQYNFTDENIAENAALLGFMGLSKDSYMQGLYMIAFALFLLVLTAGILMIASSLNSNIAQRTKFFGMMRCIGASKKQIIRFVHLEALSWCKSAIPFGIILGIVVIWILCAILRYFSPTYFADMPVLKISWIGIFSGIAVGILTVLLAARSPAKKAAKVSPLTAISGNANTIHNIRKAVNTKFYKIDTALGIHHAKMNKKNFILMVSSFALSIILFLSFSVAVNFMNHAIQPLKPYTPDIEIVSSDNTCSLSSNLIKEIEKNPNVKRVYGRMFAYDISVKFNNKDKKIDLISYEKYQFNWAKDLLIEGEIEKIYEEKDFVLTVYNSDNPLKVGDKIKLGTNNITIAGILSTSPFDSAPGTETIICSENTFRMLTKEQNYTVIDVQLTNKATDKDVKAIRDLVGENVIFSDKRNSNNEARGAYLSFALFVYGFLAVILLITVFNIINSISMSVSARIKQYGAMRAIGMDTGQFLKMITAEAVTYGTIGSIIGCIFGLPIHRILFKVLITSRWGDFWNIPFKALGIILLLVIISSFTAVYSPAKWICNMPITDVINTQ